MFLHTLFYKGTEVTEGILGGKTGKTEKKKSPSC